MSYMDGDGNRRSARNAAVDPPEPTSQTNAVLNDALSLNNTTHPSNEEAHDSNSVAASTESLPVLPSLSSATNYSEQITQMRDVITSLQAQLDHQQDLRQLELDALANQMNQQRRDDFRRLEQLQDDRIGRMLQRMEQGFNSLREQSDAQHQQMLIDNPPPSSSTLPPSNPPPTLVHQPQDPIPEDPSDITSVVNEPVPPAPRRVPAEPPAEDNPLPPPRPAAVQSSTALPVAPPPPPRRIAMDPPEEIPVPLPSTSSKVSAHVGASGTPSASAINQNVPAQPKPAPPVQPLATTGPTSSSTPSVITTPPSAASVSVPTPLSTDTVTAKLLNRYLGPKPLVIPKFTESSKKDFLEYRSLVYLNIRKQHAYKHLIIKRNDGASCFDPSMTTDDKESLYSATMDAFASYKKKDFVTTSEENELADGLELWKRLEKLYTTPKSSILFNQDLKDSLTTMRRSPSEELDNYFMRFHSKVLELKNNNISDPPIDNCIRMLKSCIATSAFEEFLGELENPETNGKFATYSLLQLIEKSKDIYETKCRINPAHKSPAVKNHPTKVPTPKPNPKPTKVIENPYEKKRGDAPTASDLAEQERLRFKDDITKADNKTSILRQWHQDNPKTCPFHPNVTKPHPFLKCRHTIKHCQEAGVSDVLQFVHNQHFPPSKPTGDEPPNKRKATESAEMAAVRKMMTQMNQNIENLQQTQQQLNENQEAMARTIFEDEHVGESSAENNTNDQVTDYSHVSLQSSSRTNTPPSNLFNRPLRLKSRYIKRKCQHTTKSISSFQERCNYVFNSTTLNTSSLSTLYKAVIDSGATHTMSAQKNLFESITYYNKDNLPQVLMGDDTTSLNIAGYGYIKFKVHGHVLRLFSYYVPNLGTTLISAKQHMKSKGCYFHAEAQNTFLAYPTFLLHPYVNHEIELLLTSASSATTVDFDEERATKVNIKSTSTAQSNVVSKNIYNTLPDPKDHQKLRKTVYFKKLVPQAQLPTQGTIGSIGFDVQCIQDETIQPGQIKPIPTGLSSAFDNGMYIRIAARSSLALKHLTVEGGVIDSDYRGEIKVIIKNNSSVPFTFHHGQRIAQFIFEESNIPFVQSTDDLPEQSSRQGGFGSTNHGDIKYFSKRIYSRKATHNLSANEFIIIHPNRRYHQKVRRGTSHVIRSTTTSTPSNESSSSSTTSVNPIVITTLDQSQNSPVNQHLRPSNPVQQSSQTNLTSSETSSFPDAHNLDSPNSDSDLSEKPYHPPINHALPKNVNMSHRNFLRSIGYRKPHKLLHLLQFLGKGNFKVNDDEYVEDVLDPGDAATLPKKNMNKEPSPLPKRFNDVWHIDIGYGPKMGIGGIKYCLLAVDKRTRYRLVYGLKNLTSSLEAAVRQFLIDCGSPPKLIRTDFDAKLNQGKVGAIFQKANVKVESAPPKRQDQNGLVERHWQTVVSMARRWLKNSLLPSDYWYFAIKRACEVCNILPTDHIPKTKTTPHELVFKKKVDYRALFPLFSVAYIKQVVQAGHIKTKWEDQSLKCIVVGQCPLSNGLLFYHPPSKQLITCGTNYKFDTSMPSGTHFNLRYDGNFYMCLQSTLDSEIHRPPSHEEGSQKFYVTEINGKKVYNRVNILNVPINEEDEVYTVQLVTTGDILQCMSTDLVDSDPTAPIEAQPPSANFMHLPWIRPNCKATLFLQDRMQTPKQGYIIRNDDNTWSFSIGRSLGNRPTIPLPDFVSQAESLVTNKKLFQGWKTHRFVLNARFMRSASNVLSHHIKCNKVSAKNLHNMQSPSSLLRHDKLHPDDKVIWDAAYEHEYRGLENIDTWETISEEEYQKIKHLSKGTLPTMAISTIKFDGDGNPTRAKYRIVALGNLDPNNWTKQDCFAPVLSQFELRLLCAFAARQGCIPKTGDVTQAFCQSYLPPDEIYVCTPPSGCPITPPNSYWKLKKTLYGLRRSPRHFYQLARKILLQIGFTQHPTSPCLFYGNLIEGEPPIYLGLYVDDFIYFSKSRKVEEKFETKFGKAIDTDFNGDIDYFLGIKFTHQKDPSGNVTINLSQEAFIDHLCHLAKLDGDAVNPIRSPYKSGFPVDSIPALKETATTSQIKLMQSYVGCLNWLGTSTRPDICTITNMLAKYTSCPTKQHIDYIRRVIKYLKSTKSLGVSYSTTSNKRLNAHVKFPIDESKLTALSDANWGPQDQSKPRPNETRQIDLFKSRSVSGYLLWFHGPLHWQSKRQTITARSSAEAEIYATDECTKCLQHLLHLTDGLSVTNEVFDAPTIIYNDNAACVQWSKNTTTKGLRHIQIRENAIRELVQDGFITIKHIEGKVNLSDMFTKEEKSTEHFLGIRDVVLSDNKLKSAAA